MGVHAGHMKCRDVARKALTVFFTAHHVRVANWYITAARSEGISSFVLALAASRANWSCVGRMKAGVDCRGR